MKKRSLFVLLAALLLVVVSGFTYAYWDTLTKTEDETITVGVGTDLVVTVNASAQAGKNLVPANVVLGVNDVNQYVFTYDVKLSKEAQEALTLNVVAENVMIDSSTDNAGLVNIVITKAASTVNNVDVLVTVTVTLTEPAQGVYTAVANKPITFDLVFSASVQE